MAPETNDCKTLIWGLLMATWETRKVLRHLLENCDLGCYRIQKRLIPGNTSKTAKKIKIPHPEWGWKIRKNTEKKTRIWPENDHFRKYLRFSVNGEIML